MYKVQYQRLTTSQLLSSAALDYDTTFAGNVQIMQVLFKADANITETITITFNSKDGSTYDTQLDTTSLTAAANYVWRPTGNCILMDGDQLTIACTAATATATIYVTVIAEPLGHQA